MRVTLCVDALEPNPGGIGRYTWALCEGLEKRADVDLRYFGRNRLIVDPQLLLEAKNLPAFSRRFRKLRRWWEDRSLRDGLVHGPNYFLPSFGDGGVITVHDLSVFRFPETHPLDRVRAFEREFERSLERSSQIITDTETVRHELIEDFAVDPVRVTAVHLGVDARFRQQSPEALEQALARLDLRPEGYALCVSTLEPRKKIPELLAAWRRLPPHLSKRYPLVLAGGSGWNNETLHADVGRGVAEGWLRHLGFVDEGLLPPLYAGAALFIYPSVYEGFGLPPLEAMACGTPIVVAGRSCMPEVCGDAAAYIDPDDPDQMLEMIEQALTDSAWREESRGRGLERARQFSWDRCIDGTISVYRKAIGQAEL